MSLSLLPAFSPEDLQKIISLPPEPNYAEVALFGDFDYSSISHQAQEIVQDTTLQDIGGLVFILEGASKEKILKIYRRSNELYEVKPTIEIENPRRIDLHKVGWYLDDHV